MSMILDGSNGVTFNDASLQGAAASPFVLKNRIINGDMVIDQRNAGASVTVTTVNYSVDRWFGEGSQSSKFTVQQNAGSVTPPVGFSNYLGATSSATTSLGATDYFILQQRIEGFNFADLAWGTANAKTVTLSFQVYSSLTGTFGGAFLNNANNRSYPFSYTISSANTWTTISITIAGDTTGTWVGATNGTGLKVIFSLGTGSTYSGTAGAWSGSLLLSTTGATSVVGTNGATFYITGVQLEQNTSATPFERRLYGQELANCQRYYWKVDGGTTGDFVAIGSGVCQTTTQVRLYVKYPVAMRAAPTISYNGSIYADDGDNGNLVTSIATAFEGLDQMMLDFNTTSKTVGRGVTCFVVNSTGNNLIASAEL
jgi:hypothetical protein